MGVPENGEISGHPAVVDASGWAVLHMGNEANLRAFELGKKAYRDAAKGSER